ncbi:MAG TPA: acyltransferase family protein [Clostridia bacterium]
MKQRIEWIDTARGIGMLLVMFAHAPISNTLSKFIYAFHMPLFFFISGYLFNSNKYTNGANFIKSKFKTLIMPFFVFSFVNSLFWLVLRRFSNHSGISVYKPFLGMFVAIRGTDWTVCQATLWFVAALFMAELIFYFTLHVTKSTRYLIIILICYSIIGCAYSRFVHVSLPWSIDVSFVGILFFGIGYLIRQNNIFETYKIVKVSLLPVYVLLWIVIAWLNSNISMFSGVYGNYILFYLSAIAGVFAFIILCKNIKLVRFITYIGENTFVFLAFHQYIIYSILNRIFNKVVVMNSNNFIIVNSIGLLYVIIATLMLIPTSYVIKKYFPFILGSTSQKKLSITH